MTGQELIRQRAVGKRCFSSSDLTMAASWLADAALELASRLEASTEFLIGDRDALYESVTCDDGSFMDPDDERQVREYDELIDANRALLARVRGKNRESADA